mgnify:CR=1 FL=1
MRSLPNMTVLCPADAASARYAVKAAYENDGPFYVRLARLATDSFYGEFGDPVDFKIGKALQIKDGTDVTIIACGYMVEQAAEALSILEAEGISARLLDMHTIKPLDMDAVTRAIDEIGKIVTVEDHNIINGLGTAVCEVVAELGRGKVKRIGIPDRFGESAPYERLLAKNGITMENIAEQARRLLA